MSIDGGHEQCIAQDGQTAIHDPAAGAGVGRRSVMVDPEYAPRFGVERHHIVGRLRKVHDPVDHQRRGLEFLQRLRLKHPLQLQIFHVRRIDLLERAVALAHVTAGVGQPVLWFLARTKQPLGGDLSIERAGN